MKILLIDDEKDIVEYVEAMPGSAIAHVKIFKAFTGTEALVLCGEQRCNLICTDHSMPVMNGLDFVRRIRNEPGPNKDTTTIFIFGNIEKLDPKRNPSRAFFHI